MNNFDFQKIKGNRGLIILALALIVFLVLPWRNTNYREFKFQDETVVVSGESKTEQKNQVASFSAGITSNKATKEEAVNEVNNKMKELTNSIKNFGIDEKDIQTQSVSVYEQQVDEIQPMKINVTNQSSTTSNSTGKAESKWVANSTLEITLKDISKANDLMDLLNKSGANNIYGPNYRIDDTSAIEKTLYDAAIADAKEKAELIARSSGRKLGKIVNVVDGGSSDLYPVYKAASVALDSVGRSQMEPGSTTVSKTLTVTFEFK